MTSKKNDQQPRAATPATSSNVLDGLLAKIDDSALRSALSVEISRLRDIKDFGLVFERHLPETARLTNHPIRRNSLVTRLLQGDHPTGVVLALAGEDATVAWETGEEEAVPTSQLVVVANFGEPIYPGLKLLQRIEQGGDKPHHVVINAENYHALQLLRFTHHEKVDVVYIDPPYNLGGDLTYNDKRVAKEDSFRHSKWLSFMDRRLRLAYDLLKPTGVIIVAIDDTEQAHLRLLLDQIFDEQNFIATIVWDGGRKNDSRYVSVGHDYMLIYAKSETRLREADIRWRESKRGVEEALATAAEIWSKHKGETEPATKEWRAWLKAQSQAGLITDAVRRYDILEAGTGRPINTYGNLTWPGGGGPMYDVLHPVTGKPVKKPNRGWIYSDPAKMQEAIEAGRVWFGPNENTIPRGISYLDEMDTQVVRSVFEQDRKAVNARLRDILGDDRFKFPKDTRVLARWIGLVTQDDPDAVVLDFFVGSGSTIQAVMEMNARDGGRRQCIAITNNEVEEKRAKKLAKEGLMPGDPDWDKWGLFQYVTKPRIETVVTGQRPDGTKHSDGLDENVDFFELTYQDPTRVERRRAFEEIAPLLWLRAGGTGPVIDTSCETFAAPDGAVYAVLFDPAYVRELVREISDREEVSTVFVITDSTSALQQAAAELPAHVEPVQLYSSYLRSFEVQVGDTA